MMVATYAAQFALTTMLMAQAILRSLVAGRLTPGSVTQPARSIRLMALSIPA